MRHSAKRFFAKALAAPHTSIPRVITVDKNAAYPKAFKELKAEGIMSEASKYLNTLVEQDHRFLKRVLATWIIRSKTSTSRRRKIFIPCLQIQAGRCTIRCRQQQTHARTMLFSRNGEASCMVGIFTSLQRLLDGCLEALTSRFARWTKPLRTSLPLSTLNDLSRSRSQL